MTCEPIRNVNIKTMAWAAASASIEFTYRKLLSENLLYPFYRCSKQKARRASQAFVIVLCSVRSTQIRIGIRM